MCVKRTWSVLKREVNEKLGGKTEINKLGNVRDVFGGIKIKRKRNKKDVSQSCIYFSGGNNYKSTKITSLNVVFYVRNLLKKIHFEKKSKKKNIAMNFSIYIYIFFFYYSQIKFKFYYIFSHMFSSILFPSFPFSFIIFFFLSAEHCKSVNL